MTKNTARETKNDIDKGIQRKMNQKKSKAICKNVKENKSEYRQK